METRFRIGSMNETFTAVAVVQRVRWGALGPGETFDVWLDDVRLTCD